jgi:oxygen-independent coproporphyrinogen-3 oxidase
MRPDRIALFGYAHVPWFKKRQRLIPEDALPGSQERFHQAESARAHLESLGYVPIGLDHFATPDDDLAQAATARRLRRSFQGYVADDADVLIGIGPSAISTLPQGYAQNATEPGAWTAAIDGGNFATARGHALDTDDRLRRRFIEQIMCEFEAELRPLGGASACVRELKALFPMFADGLIFLSNERLVLKDRARSLCRVVAAAFDVYAHEGGAARHSRAV